MGRKSQYGSDPKTIGTAGTGHKEGEATSSVFARMSGKSVPAATTPTSSTGATPKAAAAPKTGSTPTPTPAPVAKPVATPVTKPAAAVSTAPASGTFKAAYAKAREMGGSKAQFEFGGKKFQAAATKAEYVPMSQQKKVDIGSSTTSSTATATSKPPVNVPTPPSRPAGIGTPASSSTTQKTPSVVDYYQRNADRGYDIGSAIKSVNFNDMRTGDRAKSAKDRLNDAGRDNTSDDSVASKIGAAGYGAPKTSTTPSGGTGAAGGNPTPSGGGIASDAGRQSAPTNSGSSISVKPEPSSTVPAPIPVAPEKKKDTGIAVENKLNESFVSVGINKYRIL